MRARECISVKTARTYVLEGLFSLKVDSRVHPRRAAQKELKTINIYKFYVTIMPASCLINE